METQVITVPDISCDHCKAAIEEAVGAVAGVAAVRVDVAAKSVTVEGAAPRAAVAAAIADAGYEVAGPA